MPYHLTDALYAAMIDGIEIRILSSASVWTVIGTSAGLSGDNKIIKVNFIVDRLMLDMQLTDSVKTITHQLKNLKRG